MVAIDGAVVELPDGADRPSRWREKMSRIARQRIKDEGLEEAVPFLRKYLDARIRAAEMGWEIAETGFEGDILECLWMHGPLTLVQLHARLGKSINNLRLVVEGLKRRKVVAVIRREGYYCVYGLADGVSKHGEV